MKFSPLIGETKSWGHEINRNHPVLDSSRNVYWISYDAMVRDVNDENAGNVTALPI